MAEDATKTYVFDSGAGRGGYDLSTLLALINNNGGFGGNGSWLWIIFLFFLWPMMGRGNWFGGGNNDIAGVARTLNNDFGRDVLLQAINGNSTAISQISSAINADFATVQSALSAIQNNITSVGSNVGMTGQQIINAIQMGNCQLGNQFAQCCCENKTLLQAQGYENQLATANQTAVLAGKIDAQTVAMNDQFCALKERELQNRIDSLLEANSTLKAQISNSNQTAQIQAYIGSVINPIATEVASIKAAMPSTTTIPYSPVTGVPTALLAAQGYGYGYTYPNGYNGSIWA